jgi:hypothetical protein
VTTPYASIIIPVAAAHRTHVRTAVASVRWQTVRDWEVLIVNDTGAPLIGQGDARITVIDAPHSTNKRRASVARNVGIEAARGLFTIFLDADDYLLPSALETFTRGHAGHDKAYSYSHHYGLNRDGAWAQYRPPEYNRERRASPMSHSTGGTDPVPTMQGCNLHPITAFVPTWCLREAGGFDEDAPGFEDWTIWLRLAIAGFCGQRIFGPTFVYRRELGISSRPDASGGQALMDAVTAPYRNTQGDMDMAGCGCGGGAAQAKKMAQSLAATFGDNMTTDNGSVMLEYIGPGLGKQTFQHPVSKQQYRAGGSPTTKYIVVPPEDVDYLVHELRLFKRQAPPAAFVPPPIVEEAPASETVEPALTKAAKREPAPAGRGR